MYELGIDYNIVVRYWMHSKTFSLKTVWENVVEKSAEIWLIFKVPVIPIITLLTPAQPAPTPSQRLKSYVNKNE